MAWSSRNFWKECKLADQRKARGDPPRYHPEWNGQWPHALTTIPRNWDELSLEQLHALFLAQQPKPEVSIIADKMRAARKSK